MAERLPEAVLDYQLETQLGENQRYVTHIVEDADQPPSAPPRIETWKAGKYPVGEGGQGQVFLQKCVAGARHHHVRAVKTIPCGGDAGKKRYLRELDAMVRFSHEKYAKYFVRMLGWYYLQSNLCIAMEYLPGGDLQTYLRRNPPLTEQETQQIISQVVQGLDIMHKGGFAHRDIKPQNILIHQRPVPNESSAWWVKLADFGISKRIEAAKTTAGELVGTLEFMSPELIEQAGDGSHIDYRAADMWAVGAMAVYIRTRQYGFRRRRQDFDSEEAVRQAIAPNCEMSSDGIDFILKATSPHPRGRPTSGLAASHAWLSQYKPKLLIPLRANVNDDSSASSSPDSLFSAEPEMTTLATNLADTYLDGQNTTTVSLGTTTVSLGATTVSLEEPGPTQAPPPLPPRSRLSFMAMPSDKPRTMDSENASGMSMLTAASLGRLTVIKRLISEGVSSDQQNTAFVEAASKGHAPIVKLFCDARSDLTAENLIVWVALEAAITRGHGRVVSVLAEKKLDFTNRLPSGSSYLQLAITSGHAEVVRAIAETGVALDQVMNDGLTPIYSAAHDGHDKVVEVLADYVPAFLKPLRQGWGPLHIAALKGHVEVVRFLVSRGANYLSATEDNQTPIDIAITGQSTAVVSMLLKWGAKPSDVSANGNTPLFIAASAGNLELTKLLVENGAKLNAPSTKGWTALNGACAHGHFEVVKYLVDSGADVSSANKEGYTPLHSAASKGFLEITRFLTDKKVDIHCPNNDGWTPLLSAALGGHTEVFKLIAEKGGDPLTPVTGGVVPIVRAGRGGHTEAVKLLNDLQTRRWMDTLSPLVTQCDAIPYQALPANLLNHTPWSVRSNYLGDASSPKLFACSAWRGFTGTGTGRVSFVLHNGPSTKHSALAAGGDLTKEFRGISLDSVIHIAASPGTEEAAKGTVASFIMRAGLVGNDETLVLRFRIRPSILHLGEDGNTSLPEPQDFEWRRMPKDEAHKKSYHKTMNLYQLQRDEDIDPDAIAPNVENERLAIGNPWATFTVNSRYGTSKTFDFRFLRGMDGPTSIIALSTAISLWQRIIEGLVSKDSLKALLGHGKQEAEATTAT